MRTRGIDRACRHSSRDIHDSLECLLVCLVVITCALRWGVTLVGDYHYRALLTLSWDSLSGTGPVQVAEPHMG